MHGSPIPRTESKRGDGEARSARFAPSGPLALYPQAFGLEFLFAPEPDSAPAVRDDGVAVVKIVGPLDFHHSWWTDSYEAIRNRFDAALEAKPSGILLAIDSPGGLVAGCFELAEHMRARCAAAGVPLYAYAEGMCASAAYALACAASKIGASPTSIVGSIGVIDALMDVTAADSAWGLRFKFITSGTHKADGNPHVAIEDSAVVAAQTRVDDIAAHFFDHVARARSLSAEQIAALEAGTFVGPRALAAGLLDALSDPSVQLPESVTGDTMDTTTAPRAEDKPDDDEKKASDGDQYRKMRKLAEEGDEDAKKMLRRLECEPDGDKKEPAKGEDGGEAEGEDEAKALARAALARVDSFERAQLIATRPDLDDQTRELLASAPIERVRSFVSAAPRRAAASRAASAQPGVKPAALPTSKPTGAGMRDGFSPPVSTAHAQLIDYAAKLVSGRKLDIAATTERTDDGRPARTVFGVDVEAQAGVESKFDRLHRGRAAR